jgi:hypothetical protein
VIGYLYWFGVAEVIPKAGNVLLGDAARAFVGIVGIANSKDEFLHAAARAFSAMDFDLIEVADAGLVRSPEDWSEADPALRERLACLNAGNPIECGVFHAFDGRGDR